MQIKRIFDLIDQYKEVYSDKKNALVSKVGEKWVDVSAEEYIENAYSVSKGLLKLGIKRGDNVATIIRNSPEWNYFDIGIQQIGAVQVPIYPTVSIDTFRYIFKEAEVKYIIIYDEEIYNTIKEIIPDCPSVKGLYSIKKVNDIPQWHELTKLGQDLDDGEVDMIKKDISPNDLATIIYTSGTTGNPKGVMLSHHNFVTNFLAVTEIIKVNPKESVLSFLPLCHVYERMLNYMYQNLGMTINYSDSIDKIGEYMREVHPEMFCAVPRVIEKSFDKIMAKGRDLKGIKKILFFWAVNLGYKFQLNKTNGWWYHFKLKIADKLIFSKWREALGGKLEVIVSGGATLQPKLAHVFWAAGIQVMEGYGLTETSPVIAVSTFEPGGVKFGTVGPVLPGVTVKFSDEGEILCKGPNVMMGYYKNPEATKEVIDQDGWLHTGDVGILEDNKYVRITDRKKEIFKTSGGKYIAPQVLENKLKESPFIEAAMVVGENKNFAAALLVPSFDHLKSWCRVKGYDYPGPEGAVQNEVIKARIEREVNTINSRLDKTEQIKTIRLLSKPWTIEDGDLSQTLKLKRQYLLEKHKDMIEGIYAHLNSY